MENNGLYNQILQRMEEKDTEELLSILEKNDRQEWTESAFTAIRDVLTARQVPLPPQPPPIQVPPKPPRKKINLKGMSRAAILFYVLGSIFCISAVLTIASMFDNKIDGWTTAFGVLFGLSAFALLGIVVMSKLKEQEGVSSSRPKGDTANTYIVVFYTTRPPSAEEMQEIVQGISNEVRRPVKVLDIVPTISMPAGPDDFVVTRCLLECTQHAIKFDPAQDEIAFRSAMGLGVATITLHH